MTSSSRSPRPTRPTTTTTRGAAGAAAIGGLLSFLVAAAACPANRPASAPPSLNPVESGAGGQSRTDNEAAARLLADGRQPAGGTCSAGEDCLSGLCEGIGCGEDFPGVCVAKERPCGEENVVFCGCDGVEFSAPSSCPGRRFKSRGTCRAPR